MAIRTNNHLHALVIITTTSIAREAYLVTMLVDKQVSSHPTIKNSAMASLRVGAGHHHAIPRLCNGSFYYYLNSSDELLNCSRSYVWNYVKDIPLLSSRRVTWN